MGDGARNFDHGEKVRQGQNRARARGVRIGRRSVVTADKLRRARALLAEGGSIRSTAKAVGVSKSALHRALRGALRRC